MQDYPFYFLNIYKERGMSSFDVIYKLRKILNIKQIGHSGTLDPMAQGVMQVAVGKAARLLEYLDSDKTYIMEAKFGYSSDTLDAEGEIKKENPPDFTMDELILTLKGFIGKIEQTPPKYSAIKVKGKKLCDVMRKNPNSDIIVPKRQVTIYEIKFIDYTDNILKAEIKCSKGTYIRTLADDIAKKINTRAYLVNLTRTRAGSFDIKDSVKIERCNCTKHQINPVSALNLYEYKLNKDELNLVLNGVGITPLQPIEGDRVMLTYDSKLVSIGLISDNKIKIEKVFK